MLKLINHIKTISIANNDMMKSKREIIMEYSILTFPIE